MRRILNPLLALALVVLLPHCPPQRAPEPVAEPNGWDAAAFPVPVPIVDAASPLDLDAQSEASPDAGDASLGVADATAGELSPVCTTKILGQTLNTGKCGSDAECQLGTQGCCAPCGRIPSHQLRAESIHDQLNCTGIGCPKCASTMPEGFGARCLNRRCSVVQTVCEVPSPCPKLRKPKVLAQVLDVSVSGCHQDAECALAAKNCCYCGVAEDKDVVAYSRRTRYQCSGARDCPDCVTNGPAPALSAVCVSGRCRVKDTGLDSECLLEVRGR